MAWVLALAVCAACASDGPRGETPSATLGASTAAEALFRPLMRRWTLGTRQERQALDGRLIAFERRFTGDDLVRMSLVLRAFNALERSELDAAMTLVKGDGLGALSSPLYGPAGTTRDLATLVAGAVERRKGEPHKALARLRPLLHKMLDDFATNMLDEELVNAALGAHLWLDAVRYLEIWREEAEPGSEKLVRKRIAELLAKIPQEQLLEALTRRAAAGRLGKEDVARDIAQQLAIIAVGNRDIALARRLVDEYKALLGSYGEAVARLAVDTTRGKVSARTVGVLLSLRTRGMRRRSADVTAGAAYSLRTQNRDARLVSRAATADPLDVVRAMSELAGEGAAVIVAGLDPKHSKMAAQYAAEHTLPVILLTPDPDDLGGVSSFIFTLGENPANTTKRLADVMRAGGAKVVAGYGEPIASDTADTGVGLLRECDGNEKAGDLDGERVDGIVAQDGSYCGQSLMTVASTVRAQIGIGLGVAGLYPPNKSAHVLAAGIFPISAANADARLDDWFSKGRQTPSWWTALSHDAALLAYHAVRDLEETGAEDADGVRARRQQAALALTQARVTLWSTDARGFVKTQRMARSVEVVRGKR